MTTKRELATQDLAQGIAATIRRAFNATSSDDLTAQARYDRVNHTWSVRHWHQGACYDLTPIEPGNAPVVLRNDVRLDGIGPIIAADTPHSVAMRFLLVAHGGVEATDSLIEASRRTELHADLTGSDCTCPKAPCGGAIVGRGGGTCPDHDVADAGIWHWNTACPGVAS